MEMTRVSFLVVCSFFIFVFHFQHSNAFYISYVATFYSLKFKMLTDYSFPTLYSLPYSKSQPVLLYEKRITGENFPFLSDYGFCERPYPAIDWLELFFLGETFSPYDIFWGENVTCAHLCTKKFVGGDIKGKEQLDALKKGMSLKLKRHWIAADVPVLWCPELDHDIENGTENRSYCATGFPIGCYMGYETEDICSKIYDQFEYDGKYFIFNHVDLIITYEGSFKYPSESRLVNVKVIPSSTNHSDDTLCSSKNPLEIPKGDIPLGEALDIKYTYSIKFIRNDDMKWSSRWDYIFQSMSFCDLQWIPLIYSMLAVLIIVLIPVNVIKAVYKDSKSYKMMDCGEGVEPKLRWKLVTHGYANPAIRVSLSILLGSVVQLMCMIIAALGFSIFAYLQADGRDSQMLWASFIFCLLGTVGGYCASFFYKGLGGERLKVFILITSIICSGIAVSAFAVLDCMLFFIDSTASLPIYTLSAFLGVMYIFLVLFTAAGSTLGF